MSKQTVVPPPQKTSGDTLNRAPGQKGEGKTKVEKAHTYLQVASTSVAIAGALGTAFVWLAANFYVGHVELKSEQPLNLVTTKVYDQQGQQATFYTSKFQLMPGHYHFEVTPEKAPPQHFEHDIAFNKTTVLELGRGESAESEASKRWWQFWRRKQQAQ